MGIARGLKQMQQIAERNAERAANRKDYFDFKNNLLKVNDGQSVRIRFAQELDEDSPNYVPENGVGVLATEHRPQATFPKRVTCTMDDEEECWACERRTALYEEGTEEAQKEAKEWRQRTNLYINVLVEDNDGNWVPKVLSQGYGPKSVAPWLVEYAGEAGSITNQVFRLKRTGAGQNDTSYALLPGAPDAAPFDYSQYELFDLDTIFNNIPSAEMEAYFAPKEAGEQADKAW